MSQHCRHSSFPLFGLFSLLILLSFSPVVVGASGLSYTVSLESDQVIVAEDGDKTEVRVLDRKFYRLSDEGLPELPYRLVSFVLPQGTVVDRVEFSGDTPVLLAEGAEVSLAPPLVARDGTRAPRRPLVEPAGSEYPPVYGRYLGTGLLHGYSVASVAVFPLRAGDGGLTLTKNITVRVTTKPGAPPPGIITRARHIDGFRENIYRQLESVVVNPRTATEYAFPERISDKKSGGFQPTSFPSLEGSPVDYVIVTTDEMAAAYQTLADWKTSKGVPAVVRTVEWIQANYKNGSDLQETIRFFIQDAYAKWGITYVLLGGDSDQIPPRLGASYYLGNKELPVDMYYACLDGDWNADHDQHFGEGGATDNADLYAEVYVGRLTTTNPADVSLITAKIIDYESSTDSDFAAKALLLAEVLFPEDWTEGQPISVNGATFAENVYNQALTDPSLAVTRMYETDYLFPGSVPENRTAAIDSLNSGFNQVNHVGHGFRFTMSVGNGSILNDDAAALVNSSRYSNFFLLNCTAVAFTYSCLAEHLLLNPGGGAVSTIGSNESAFPIASSLLMYDYYDLLYNQDVVHIGETFARSRLSRTPIAALADNSDLYTHYIYTILADPEMMLWNGPLETLDVVYETEVSKGSSTIDVTVTSGGSPVQGATVCLSKGTDDYQYGPTNASGQASFDFRAESAGVIDVVVTARNKIRHDGTITVNGAGGAYVSLNGMTIDDDNIGGTTGNGDGIIDAGETVDLFLEMVNSGQSASGNVELVLRSDEIGVTVVDSTAVVGPVDSAGTAVAGDALRVYFSAGLADESSVTFDLVVREDGFDAWRDVFVRTVHAPALESVVIRIDDSASGNGDGVVDAGETFSLYLEVKNFGTGTAYGLTAALNDHYNKFVFLDSTDAYPDLLPMTQGENISGFTMIEPDVSVENSLEIVVSDAYGRTMNEWVELRPPVPPASLSFNPAFGSDRLSVEWELSTSADAERYNVFRSSVPGGPYTRINVDPVNHSVFMDVGLAASTRYYYIVTTVDGSGNESAPSAEFNGSTNPDQMSGWPIQMTKATVSSPAIGDIDGDGDLEIIQGNEKVFAWHHDGNELLDGDADAHTWGILSPEGDEFVSPVALAQVDGLPGRDIIAASRNTREVYVFNYTGAVVAGWPQPVENTIRAAMSVGDLNDDGALEIVAVDEKGVIYVWNLDGTEFLDGDANPATTGVFYRLPGCSFMYSSPALADLDNNGTQELIIGSQSEELYVMDYTATILPGWPIALTSAIAGSPAVGDIDGDGDLEIVANSYLGHVRAYHHDGSTLWQKWFKNNVFFGPSPALADLDGDGTLEMIIPSADKKVYCIRHNGANQPGWPVVYSELVYTESSAVIADMNGDGSPDVIVGDESKMISAWDVNGDILDGFPLGTTDANRAIPAIEDVDGDGDVDMIAAGWDRYVWVWDFPGAYDRNASHWNSYQANFYNNGWFGYEVPTGIAEVAFEFDAGPRGVEISWRLPPTEGRGEFHVSRATVERSGGTPGAFGVVARGRTADEYNTIRYTDGSAGMGERYVYRLTATSGGKEIHTTPEIYVPVTVRSLSQNYPNPFNPATRIEYFVPEGEARRVALVVYDVSGARVKTLLDRVVTGGKYAVEWDGRNDHGESVGSGVYFYRMVDRGFTQTRKMLLLK